MLSRQRFFLRVLSGVLIGFIALAPVGPTSAQDSFSEACPDGFRTPQEANRAAQEVIRGIQDGDRPITDESYRDWSCTDLLFANLTEANFPGVNFRWSSLVFADLTGADLYRANLSNADLREADLTGANLMGADLRRALNLSTANLSRAHYSTETQFPPGFDPSAAGMILDHY